MKAIEERIRALDESTCFSEEELFEAYMDILSDEDFTYEQLESVGLFTIPISQHENKYGEVEYIERLDKIDLNNYAKSTFIFIHQMSLLGLIEERIKDWSDCE